jgi:hypothetical protein
MAKAGAPVAAVSFTRELHQQSHGDFGVMTGFQSQGSLAFAWVTYPLRANTNNGLLLVNGRPSIVNLEDLKLLDTKTMEQSSQFHDLKGQFPQVNLWPGDRDGKTWPTPQAGPNGGSQFVLEYPLRNGCHACARSSDCIPGTTGLGCLLQWRRAFAPSLERYSYEAEIEVRIDPSISRFGHLATVRASAFGAGRNSHCGGTRPVAGTRRALS